MSVGLFIAVSLFAVLFLALAGVILFGRFLLKETRSDEQISVDLSVRPKRPYSDRFLRWFSGWRGGGPRRLTYRRDDEGQFHRPDH